MTRNFDKWPRPLTSKSRLPTRVKPPVVSVVITCRGSLPWISDAVQSVIEQTFQDWELLIIDDGADLGFTGLLALSIVNDPRVRVLRNPNRGRGCALNYAINRALGEWVSVLDADDLFHPEKLDCQLRLAKSVKKTDVICSAPLIIRECDRPSWAALAGPYEQSTSDYEDISGRMVYRNLVTHSSVLVRRELLGSVGGYDENRCAQVDYELWLRLLEQGVRFVRLPSQLTAKRLHKGQFFEGQRRLWYLSESLRLQMDYACRLKAGLYVYALVFCKFFYGVLPMNLRRHVAMYRIFGRA